MTYEFLFKTLRGRGYIVQPDFTIANVDPYDIRVLGGFSVYNKDFEELGYSIGDEFYISYLKKPPYNHVDSSKFFQNIIAAFNNTKGWKRRVAMIDRLVYNYSMAIEEEKSESQIKDAENELRLYLLNI